MLKKQRHKVNLTLYLLPGDGITHEIIANIQPQKIVFYSSVLALSSAALAFLGQLTINSGSSNQDVLIVVSIAGFGTAILTLILIYFLHIVHSTYYEKIEHYYKRMIDADSNFNVQDSIKHTYFKENPKDLRRFKDAMHISARLMGLEVKLDVFLLFSVFIGVIFYSAKLIGF